MCKIIIIYITCEYWSYDVARATHTLSLAISFATKFSGMLERQEKNPEAQNITKQLFFFLDGSLISYRKCNYEYISSYTRSARNLKSVKLVCFVVFGHKFLLFRHFLFMIKSSKWIFESIITFKFGAHFCECSRS